MKKLSSLIILILCIAASCRAQVIFVEPTDKGYESKIIEKLKYDGYKITNQKSDSDLTLICLVRQTSKINSMYKGYLRIEDSKTGKELGRTEEVRRGAVAVNGFNAGNNIFEVIAKKYLNEELKKYSNSYPQTK